MSQSAHLFSFYGIYDLSPWYSVTPQLWRVSPSPLTQGETPLQTHMKTCLLGQSRPVRLGSQALVSIPSFSHVCPVDQTPVLRLIREALCQLSYLPNADKSQVLTD